MEKPQRLFKDTIDNSPLPFVPKIIYKPFGQFPLGTFLIPFLYAVIYCQILDLSKNEHPYKQEILGQEITLSDVSISEYVLFLILQKACFESSSKLA